MIEETPAQLVAHLSDVPMAGGATPLSNCWCSATTSRWCRRCSSSRNAGGNLLGRFHAVWTLEGLGALNASMIRELMKDANPRMRIQAIRASESLFKAGDRSFEADYRKTPRRIADTGRHHSGDAER